MLSYLEKQEIQHKMDIEELKDIKELIIKEASIFNQKRVNGDIVYAQKFILQYQVKSILNKIKKIKRPDLVIINELKDKLEIILKRKEIFDHNLKILKKG